MEGNISRAWRRLKKKHGWTKTDLIRAELQKTMRNLLPVPEEMALEAADYFLSDSLDESVVDKAEEFMELMAGQWTAENSALTKEDWIFIRELVNAWAGELDMDTVTDVMRAVVDRGAL